MTDGVVLCPTCGTDEWIVTTLEKNSRTEYLYPASREEFVYYSPMVRRDKDEEVIETSVEQAECVNGHYSGESFGSLVEAWNDADYLG